MQPTLNACLGRAGLFAAGIVVAALAGCGGDGSSSPPLSNVTVTTTGLDAAKSVVLQDNGGNNLTVAANGTANFSTQLAQGSAYSVTVLTQPSGQTCTVTGGSGTVATGGVAVQVAVGCVDVPSFKIGGTLSGLPNGATVELFDNGGDALDLTANGAFDFTSQLATGASYAVTVNTQPAGATCTVTNGTGTVGSADVANVAVSCLATGLSSSTTSSTAFAVLATSTARVAFLPRSASVVPFSIDGTAVSAGAVRGGSAKAAGKARPMVGGAAVGLSFTPDSCTVDSNALIVSCISYQGTKIGFLDVSTFATSLKVSDITATEFDTGVPQNYTSFSGGSCILCGIVAVTGKGEVVISAFDGYHVIAYPAAGASSPLPSAQSYALPITENFAVDPVRLTIAASEYANSGSRTLRLIDMTKQKIYAWVTDTSTCGPNDPAACTNDFRFEETDSESFDVATGMLVLQSESGNSELMLDLSQATFDDAENTFDAPHLYSDVTNPYFAEMSGALASPTHSYLFMVPEFSSAYAGVEVLPTAGTGGAFATYSANPVFIDLNAPAAAATVCGGTLSSGGDPHSEGFTTSLAGTDLGLFITGDRSCIVKIDLAKLYAAPRDATHANQVDATYDLVANGVLTYVKVN